MTEKYDLIEIIGQGMYGKVYKALNKFENKFYAIKTMNFKNITPKERLNIDTEINLLQELKHPNIVLYKESFIDENQNLNIVTTFCEGGDLYQKIFKSQKTYFQEKEIINALIQLLLGLSYIHDKKIVHRDIKTKNIFIQNEHTLRIGDFGIAKIFNSNKNSKNTNLNKMVGTPLYMAPECFKQNKKYSYKSDIWSLGCCIYEMCNLKHAFEGQFFPAVSIKISEGKRLPLNKIYSKELRNVIDNMLNLNPRNRPTIASLIEKTFLKKYVGEYINDFISNYRRYEGNEEQIDILKEQADKFKIFDVKLNLDNLNLNGCYKNENNLLNNADIYNNEKININDEDKKIDLKPRKNINSNNNYYQIIDVKDNKYSSLVNEKYKENKKYKKVLNISPEQKNKNYGMSNYLNNNNNKILVKQQSTINYNYYNESFDNFNINIKNRIKNKKLNKKNEHERINIKNKSDNLYNINELNQPNKNIENENNFVNEKQFIINKRIKNYKDRSIKALGNNFYNKAYNYLKKTRNDNLINNDIKREYLSDTFGKNNIGYWQLIEQILILEDILESS